MEIAEGKGLNPYFEGQFDGESNELRALRLTLVRERDEAIAEVERLRKTLDEIATYWNGSHRPAETLDAAEWMRGVAEEALAATESKP